MSEIPLTIVSARDAVLLVVGDLDRAPAVGLVDRLGHRVGVLVGVHQHLAADVARRAADRLDQRRLAAQEALLVGVEDRDQRDLRQVEPLAQQVDADEHVVLAQPQLADDLDPLERVDLGVQVADLEAHLEQVVRQVLAHLLRERRDQRALVALDALADLAHQVVDLVARLAHLDLRVDDPGRAHDLLDHARGVRALVLPRRGRHEDELRRDLRGTPGTSAAGCRARSAAGSRSRRASACASGRPRACRRSAAPSGATRR